MPMDLRPLAAADATLRESLRARARGALAAAFHAVGAPAFIQAHAHPREEAVLVEIVCGQDGCWLKTAVREGSSLREHAHELSEPTEGFPLLGIGADGSHAVTADPYADETIQIRTWPSLVIAREVNLGGSLVAGAAGGDTLLVTVAEVSEVASRFELRSLSDGELIRAGSWPAGETLHAIVSDVAVTTAAGRVRAFRVV